MADPTLAPFDPASYAQQEGIGQVPQFLRLGPLRLFAVQGVPSAALGANGDFALRQDGAAGANTTIYFKAAGAWTGLTC